MLGLIRGQFSTKGTTRASSRVRRVPNSLSWCLTAPALILLCAACAGAQNQAVNQRVVGCYALAWSPWKVGDSIGVDGWEATTERRVWLTATPIARKEPPSNWFVVRPAPGASAGTFAEVRWTWNELEQGVTIAWDGTMAGIQLQLTPRGKDTAEVNTLEGTARWWSTDATVPQGLGAKVRASRQVCAELD